MGGAWASRSQTAVFPAALHGDLWHTDPRTPLNGITGPLQPHTAWKALLFWTESLTVWAAAFSARV